jgi:hypothetical protein
MGDFLTSVGRGGWGVAAYHKNHRAGECGTTADGGRAARIDEMDEDGPYRQNPQDDEVGAAGIEPAVNPHGKSMSEHMEKHPDHRSTRKHYFVSHHSALGGSGLHQGHKEK